ERGRRPGWTRTRPSTLLRGPGGTGRVRPGGECALGGTGRRPAALAHGPARPTPHGRRPELRRGRGAVPGLGTRGRRPRRDRRPGHAGRTGRGELPALARRAPGDRPGPRRPARA